MIQHTHTHRVVCAKRRNTFINWAHQAQKQNIKTRYWWKSEHKPRLETFFSPLFMPFHSFYVPPPSLPFLCYHCCYCFCSRRHCFLIVLHTLDVGVNISASVNVGVYVIRREIPRIPVHEAMRHSREQISSVCKFATASLQ